MYFRGNDQLAVTSSQLFFATVFIILSYLVNGSIFGYMAVLLRLMYKRGNAEQDHKDNTSKIMNKVVLSNELQDSITRYER
jgi:hypothetical protein